VAEAEFIERRLVETASGRLDTRSRNIDRTQSYIDVQKRGGTVRIYGTQEQLDRYQNKKPDGSPNQITKAETAIPQGIVDLSKSESDKAVNEIVNGKSTIKPDTNASTSGVAGSNLENIIRNPLETFASYSPLWTLAVLTPQQFNNPLSYRNANGLSFGGQSFDVKTKFVDDDGGFEGEKTTTLESGIIFSSAGRGDQYRTATAFGTPEYYIDNFEMTSVVAANTKTGNQNAISFTFDIMEPYSMGLLLQTLQVAAIKAGYVNYLDSPFLLKLDLVGYGEDGKVIKTIKPKFFVVKLKKVTFNVDETGSKYAVEAYPFNHQGYADTVDTAWTDINIQATTDSSTDTALDPDERGTVRDVLATGQKSLVKLLNDNEQQLVNEGKYKIKDIYEIQFPESSSDFISHEGSDNTQSDQGATVTPGGPPGRSVSSGKKLNTTNKNIGNNTIAKSDFGFDVGEGGNFPFKDEKDVIDEETGRVKRGVMQIDEKARSFHFMQSQKLTDIITQVILSSTYAKKATQESLTADGFINWFKIDVQVEFLEYDDLIGDFAKKYTFRVVPFKVHSSVFGNPNAVPPGLAELERKIVKRYDYIYTGQNVDVLNFEIKIDYLFYSGANPATESKTKNEQNMDNKGVKEQTAKEVKTQEGEEKKAQTANLGKSKIKKDPGMFSMMKGGSGSTNVEQKVAENFQNAFINVTSADLVKVDLDIVGDTFWLVDSGLSNYFAKESDTSSQLTEDGTMNYEGSDIYIYISFRTPADINTKRGLIEFSYKDKESPFSGVYRVYKCISHFESGKFTQTLQCVRMQAQPQDFDGKTTTVNKQTSTQVKIGGESKPKDNPSEKTSSSATDTIPAGTQGNETDGSVSGLNIDIDGP